MKDFHKEMFSLMDGVNEEKMLEIFEETEGDSKKEVSENILTNIKKKTYKKAGVNPYPLKSRKKRGWRGWKTLAASFLIIILVGAATGSFAPAWARMKQALQFIPGLGIVLDNEEEITRYVLENPINKRMGEGAIRIKAVLIDSERAMLTITGTDVMTYKDVLFRDGQGREYAISGYSISSGGDGPEDTPSFWEGTYVYEGKIGDISELQVVLGLHEDIVIPIALAEAQTYDSYSDLGPTAAAHGLSVTAVTSLEGGKFKVNLLSPPRSNMKIKAYGTNPNLRYPVNQPGEAISLTDGEGKRYSISAASGYAPPLSEFFFDISQSEETDFSLSIPFIDVVNTEAEATITVKVPQVGSAARIDQVVEMAGFPIKFMEVERGIDAPSGIQGSTYEDKLRIYLDLGYSEGREENLISFRLDEMKLPSEARGWGYTVNQETGVMQYLEVTLPENTKMKELKLYLNEPMTRITGPWDFEVPMPN